MQKLLVLGLLTTSIIFGMAPAMAGDRDHKPNFRAEYHHNYHHDYRRIYRDNYRYDQRRDQYHDRRFHSHNYKHNRFHSHNYKHNKYRKHYGHPGRQKKHDYYRRSAADDYIYIIGGAVLLNEILHHRR